MTPMIPTGESTLGPFFPPRYVDAGANDLTVLEGRKAKGEAIEISGRVLQSDGAPLENLVLEIWQADAQGKYAHPEHGQKTIAANAFRGFGRVLTEAGTDPAILIAICDPRLIEETRRNWPFLRDRRIDAYAPILSRYLGAS